LPESRPLEGPPIFFDSVLATHAMDGASGLREVIPSFLLSDHLPVLPVAQTDMDDRA